MQMMSLKSPFFPRILAAACIIVAGIIVGTTFKGRTLGTFRGDSIHGPFDASLRSTSDGVYLDVKWYDALHDSSIRRIGDYQPGASAKFEPHADGGGLTVVYGAKRWTTTW